MKIIAIIIFLSTSVSVAADMYDCNTLPGKWLMVDYDTRLAAQRESITTINSDGSFDIESRQTTGVSEYIHTESGTWKCTGKEYIFYTNIINGVESENTVMYEIIELTESYQKSSTINEDCESVITDCPATYEFMRIQ